MSILYSLVIPYHHRPKVFGKTLDTFVKYLSNRYDYEILIMESENNYQNEDYHKQLQKIVKTYSKKINIKSIRVFGYTGVCPAVAYNMGVVLAKGKYVLFTQPELLFENDVLAVLDKQLTKTPESFVIISTKWETPTGYTWHVSSKDPNGHTLPFCIGVAKSVYEDCCYDNIFAAGVYYEDDDLRNKIRTRKVPVVITDEATVLHQQHGKGYDHGRYAVKAHLQALNYKIFSFSNKQRQVDYAVPPILIDVDGNIRNERLQSGEQIEETIKQRKIHMSKFNPVLCIMHPREIPECINAIRANAKMPETHEEIPITWFKAFNEPQVCAAINKYVKETNFSHYIIFTDDNILYRHAMAKLINLTKGLSKKEAKKNIITGWSNMHLEKDGSMSDISNVCAGEVTLINGQIPLKEDYPGIMTVDEINKQDKVIQTGCLNCNITCIPRELLIKYPMATYSHGCASDHHWSFRMQKDGIKFWIHRDTFVRHLRQGWKPLRRNWLVGAIEPIIIEERHKQ